MFLSNVVSCKDAIDNMTKADRYEEVPIYKKLLKSLCNR
jgi:hypothetical protein